MCVWEHRTTLCTVWHTHKAHTGKLLTLPWPLQFRYQHTPSMRTPSRVAWLRFHRFHVDRSTSYSFVDHHNCKAACMPSFPFLYSCIQHTDAMENTAPTIQLLRHHTTAQYNELVNHDHSGLDHSLTWHTHSIFTPVTSLLCCCCCTSDACCPPPPLTAPSS